MISTNALSFQSLEQHQTPIKKGKDVLLVQPKTAESEPESWISLESIEAKQLFEQFQKIVKITEDEDCEVEDQSSVQRKLDYQSPISKMKLNFSPNNSSMKKRERICHKSYAQPKFQGIILFDANEKENQNPKERTDEKFENQKKQNYLTPIAKERELKKLGSRATCKKVDFSD